MNETKASNPTKDMLSGLKDAFPAADIEWLPKKADANKYGQVFPFVQREAIQERLDQVAGMDNWRTEYTPLPILGEKGAQICALSIRVNGEWVTKCDGAANSEYEAVKGGITNAFKRAASCWGIGRYLNGFPAVSVQLEPVGKGYRIPAQSRQYLDNFYNQIYFPPKSPEYVVRSASFDGSTTQLVLYNPTDKQDYNALLLGANQELAEGICLTGVKLEPVKDAGYNLLKEYAVAA